ncbi:2Fe-2S iron-sulfur cluster protein [Bacillus oleivorans]|uniref:2Fe-2S iron-sulfur cluster protein n=1 Tax=Bacillus oleivorans TaxID=1448271 RepID=A0A285D6K6_9BACI|nr:(2Fe-2S)-binding protein [Bacillus oleivorans]SNX74966.1 2Fe-2S iron-sulfur cluster protein [Bacillus oleivorans]
MRIKNHPILGPLDEANQIIITFNGKKFTALEGESIAAALFANGIRILRYTEKENAPRGVYCGIGHCYECRVSVNGQSSVRACITPVRHRMNIESQRSIHT